QWQRVHRGPGVHAAWHGAGNRSGSGGAGGDGALAGRAAGPPDGQQGGKGAGAGVIPGRSPDKAEGRIRGGPANSHHRDQPPYRLANPLPYPLFRSESGTPGALRLPGLRRPRGMGLETGVDLEALAETGRWLAALLGRPTGSKVGKALAGVILAVARIRPKAASGAGEPAPPRSAAVPARQSSPYSPVPQGARSPGCAYPGYAACPSPSRTESNA